MDYSVLSSNLEKLGYDVFVCENRKEAAEHLRSEIKGKTVGIGGSISAQEIGAYEALGDENTVVWHMKKPEDMTVAEARLAASRSQIYISSVNGISEKGEIVNIDNTGNRVAGTLYGPEKIYLIVGTNKVAPDLEKALWRARNIASPKNAQRLGKKTPCAVKGDRCYDCSSPDRICNALTVFWKKPKGSEYEVILVNEELGY